jgi:hypothetical protein
MQRIVTIELVSVRMGAEQRHKRGTVARRTLEFLMCGVLMLVQAVHIKSCCPQGTAISNHEPAGLLLLVTGLSHV